MTLTRSLPRQEKSPLDLGPGEVECSDGVEVGPQWVGEVKPRARRKDGGRETRKRKQTALEDLKYSNAFQQF